MQDVNCIEMEEQAILIAQLSLSVQKKPFLVQLSVIFRKVWDEVKLFPTP